MTSLARKCASWLIAGSLVVAIFFLAYPIYVIRPWRHQGANELQIALAVLRYQHLAGWICAATALIALTVCLRSPTWRKIGAIAGAALVVICAALSRINIYEIMFHPAGAPSFQTVSDTKLDGDQKVLAVNARAWPIRSISYHHVVNDVVDGVPLVATY